MEAKRFEVGTDLHQNDDS